MAEQLTAPHRTFYQRAIDLLEQAALHVEFDASLAADISKLADDARQKRQAIGA